VSFSGVEVLKPQGFKEQSDVSVLSGPPGNLKLKAKSVKHKNVFIF
jgi:hypothetical protein